MHRFALLLFVLALLVGCAGKEESSVSAAQATPVAPSAPSAAPTPATIAEPTPLVNEPAAPPAERDFFAIAEEDYGLSRDRVQRVIDQAQRQQSILDAMNRPAEKVKRWHEYRLIFLDQPRIDGGVAFWREHEALLTAVSQRFGVPESIIVAIIGVETRYGRIMGSYRVVDALHTLAFYHPPRAPFFSKELLEFIRLAEVEQLSLYDIKGSYAGAMGIGQFMPSSYRHYAVDFDNDGRRDLFGSRADAIASVANYLAGHDWERGEPIATLSRPTAEARQLERLELKPSFPTQQLEDWGYAIDPTLDRDKPATLVTLEGASGPEHWVAFQNFYVITRYNRSPKYAMAVAQLAAALEAAR